MKKIPSIKSFYLLMVTATLCCYGCETKTTNEVPTDESGTSEEQSQKYEVTKEQYELLQFLSAEESDFPDGNPDFFPDTTGGLIGLSAAREKYRHFKETNGTTPQIQPYAFGFGLKEMKDFIEKIEAISNPEDSSRWFTGFRVYLTANKKPAFKHLDVLMVPVNIKGDDLYELDPFIDEDIILNSSMPCPENCTD